MDTGQKGGEAPSFGLRVTSDYMLVSCGCRQQELTFSVEITGRAVSSSTALRETLFCALPADCEQSLGSACVTPTLVPGHTVSSFMSSVSSCLSLVRASATGFPGNLDTTATDSKPGREQGLEEVTGHSICSNLIGISSVLSQALGGQGSTNKRALLSEYPCLSRLY